MLERTELQDSIKFEVGSIWNPSARDYAISLVKRGKPIGVFNRGVCAIWGDGESDKFIEEVIKIKGEDRRGRPMGATLRTEDLINYIDRTRIPENLHGIILDACELTKRLGSLCFIRIPITTQAANNLPQILVSGKETGNPVIQNWDPWGHRPTRVLIEKMLNNGIRYPAVTSMNTSGTPEIVDQLKGIDFSRKRQIPIFLEDPKDNGVIKGSYTTFGIDHDGLKLIRDGNIPGNLFKALFNFSFDNSNAILPKYDQADFPELLTNELDPYEARIAIISFIHGYPIENIRSAIRKLPIFKNPSM